MTEQNEEKPAPFDAEWRCEMLSRRIIDILSLIDELKAKDTSLSARISRLRLESIEETDEDEEARVRSKSPQNAFEDMTLEEKAIKVSEVLDRLNR